MKIISINTAFILARQFVIALLIVCGVLPAFSQLHADFIVDKTGGCSPLAVLFTNTTSGASNTAKFHWDFDNGNQSSLKNASAIFNDERNYTITLTVTDGTQTSTQTKPITVYKKPMLDFSISPSIICIPTPATLTAIASGDGTISSYHWDFGDGVTLQTGNPSALHYYNIAQTASVSLTTINNFGCSNTVTKLNAVTVNLPVQAGFAADKTITCVAPGTIQFSNSSNGPGTLSYEWDFGDGSTSILQAPTHVYMQKGIYNVKLTVTSSLGCVAVISKPNYINIANFNSDFQFPSLICTDGNVLFTNTSTPNPGQCTWLFDGVNPVTTSGNGSASFSFGTSGIHTVALTNTFGDCQETVSKQVTINDRPVLSGFIAEINNLCGAPTLVNFQDTTNGAVAWSWNFDVAQNFNAGDATTQTSSHTYVNDNSYQVKLLVSNAAGCLATAIQNVNISKPLVGIFLDDGAPTEGCDHMVVKFNPRSTEPIAQYHWDFSDGGTSTDPSPLHDFTQPRSYVITLNYTTVSGCVGTATYHSIVIREKPTANFIVSPTVCGNTPVLFTNTSTGFAFTYVWDFGDNTGNQLPNPPIHAYQQEGDYTVKLIAYNGLCNDTTVRTNIIKVLPPFPKIAGAVNTCNGTRGEVAFTDATRGATNWQWDFGDGNTTSYTVYQNTLTHLYTKTGSYKVVLSTTSGSCTVKDSVIVYVLLKQNPVLSPANSIVCSGSSLSVQIGNLERPVTPQPSQYPYSYDGFWFSDGSFFNQFVSASDLNAIPWSAQLYNLPYGDLQIKTVARSNYFGCSDTSNFIAIKVGGPSTAINVLTSNACFKNPVLFKDNTTARNNVAAVSCVWNFGDNTSANTVVGATVSHRYVVPGSYYATVTVKDANGCTASSSQSVNVSGPKASFTSSGTNVPLNTTVAFTNTTNNYNSVTTTYHWDFGDGIITSAFSPSHTYPTAGTYTITLIAQNAQTSCTDTSKQTITVANFNAGFSMSVSFIGKQGSCPPVLAKFFNTSVNYTKLVWDFGDGFTVENQSSPGHIYTTPGNYFVTLSVYGFNGLTGLYRDTIRVSQPTVTINANIIAGCIKQSVTFNAPLHAQAINYLWDFGNGFTQNSTDSFSTHQFLEAGNYVASVIAKDLNGCPVSAALTTPVVIHPDPVISIAPDPAIACKENAVQLQASGGNTYVWSPSVGLDNALTQSPMCLPVTTTMYKVKAKDSNGCEAMDSVEVNVPNAFLMTVTNNLQVCKGDQIQMKVSGATSYSWINTTSGLSNTQINNPIVATLNTTDYTIVGFDPYLCFSDTQNVHVIIHSLPTLNAGPPITVAYGSPTQLQIVNSSDVVRWNWSPSTFLNCITCAAPVSKPYSAMDYVVTVYTDNNCVAKDTLHIAVLCKDADIRIPNAFSPDGNGKNDGFTIIGNGVRVVKSIRIYNRWGEVVFEKKDFQPNDHSAAWDGNFKGMPAPAGAYVYFAEMECMAGEIFTRKGSVILVR